MILGKKSPSKAELEQLQKLYKTDEKIGERLGGVPSYLVAYWRRKKNIPKYSLPKFPESEIRNLWERYGDDDKCGMELGISKAAFYNWRRKYGLKEKPLFLKLEQLEFNFPGTKSSAGAMTLFGKQTISQKIIAGLSDREKIEVGETVELEPDLAVTDNEIERIIEIFEESGSNFLWNPSKNVLINNLLENSPMGLSLSDKKLRDFARLQKIRKFYDIFTGYTQRLIIENGIAHPGKLIIGNSFEIFSVAALTAMPFKINSNEMASLWGSGKLTITVPSTIRIELGGRKVRSISARDIGLHVMDKLSGENLTGKAIEYYGSVISHFSIGERSKLASTSYGLNVSSVICQYDASVRRYLRNLTNFTFPAMAADKDAVYESYFHINIEKLLPQIAGPNDILKIKTVAELESLTVSQIFLGGPESGKYEDLRIAADILKGEKVDKNCRLFIIPASRKVYLEALRKGLIRIFSESGAIILPAGYNLTLMNIMTMLSSDEVCLTTVHSHMIEKQEKNLPIKQDNDFYLCSSSTAAASAVKAEISDPIRFLS